MQCINDTNVKLQYIFSQPPNWKVYANWESAMIALYLWLTTENYGRSGKRERLVKRQKKKMKKNEKKSVGKRDESKKKKRLSRKKKRATQGSNLQSLEPKSSALPLGQPPSCCDSMSEYLEYTASLICGNYSHNKCQSILILSFQMQHFFI